jgi:diacylglycerol kinase family enzyme
VTTLTLFIANNRLQLEQVGLTEAAALDEGCLAAVTLRPSGALPMLWLLFRGASGTLGEARAVESFKFHRMVAIPRLALGRRAVKVAYDGEVSRMRVPLEFRVAARPLYLLKPTAEDGAADHAAGAA